LAYIDDRIASDRTLFERSGKDFIYNLLANSNQRLVAGAIAKAIELQVLTEEIAREKDVEINADVIAEYMDRNRDYINKQIKRAMTSFISSVVSQEGG